MNLSKLFHFQFFYKELEQKVMEAPVHPFPQDTLQNLINLLSVNFGVSVRTDPTFLKEMKDVEHSYEEVMKLIRGFIFLIKFFCFYCVCVYLLNKFSLEIIMSLSVWLNIRKKLLE